VVINIYTIKDIHNSKRQINNALKNVEKSKYINKMDKNTIKEVSIYLTAQSVSDSRHARYLWTLKQIAAEVPTTHTLKRLDKSDILKVGVHITKFSKYTKDEYRKTLRLLNKVSLKKLPELPKTKNRKRYNKECHPRETILEVINLIPHNSEEYKLGNFLWDSGGRTGEGFNLITGWVYPDLHGCRARMVGKTGDRVIRLLENSAPQCEHIQNIHVSSTT